MEMGSPSQEVHWILPYAFRSINSVSIVGNGHMFRQPYFSQISVTIHKYYRYLKLISWRYIGYIYRHNRYV